MDQPSGPHYSGGPPPPTNIRLYVERYKHGSPPSSPVGDDADRSDATLYPLHHPVRIPAWRTSIYVQYLFVGRVNEDMDSSRRPPVARLCNPHTPIGTILPHCLSPLPADGVCQQCPALFLSEQDGSRPSLHQRHPTPAIGTRGHPYSTQR